VEFLCRDTEAILNLPKTGEKNLQASLFFVFETEVYHTVTGAEVFKRGDPVATSVSRGKQEARACDPKCLLFMKTFNDRCGAMIDIIHSGETSEVKEEVKAVQKAQRRTSK